MKKMKKAKKVKKAKKTKKLELGAIFDAHVRHEFVDHDVAATMETMAAEPYVHNVPTLIGGSIVWPRMLRKALWRTLTLIMSSVGWGSARIHSRE